MDSKMLEDKARVAWATIAEGIVNLQMVHAIAEPSTIKHGSSDIRGLSCWKEWGKLPNCDPREIQLDGQHRSAISTDADRAVTIDVEVLRGA